MIIDLIQCQMMSLILDLSPDLQTGNHNSFYYLFLRELYD